MDADLEQPCGTAPKQSAKPTVFCVNLSQCRAARKVWPGMQNYTALDSSTYMLDVTKKLCNNFDPPIDFCRELDSERTTYSLVTAAFVLSDLTSDAARRAIVESLFDACEDVLVLVDRGTPEGFRVLRDARTQLLSLKSNLHDLHVVAPCNQEGKCPMGAGWCHFNQRLQPTALQNEMDPSSRDGFVDFKFSYLIIRKQNRPQNNAMFEWPRLIRPPLKRTGHVIIDVCGKQNEDGALMRFVVAKSHGKAEYGDGRKARWGNLWPHQPQAKISLLDGDKPFKIRMEQEPTNARKKTSKNGAKKRDSPIPKRQSTLGKSQARMKNDKDDNYENEE